MKKILHLCIANFYIEGQEYQENVLPRKHKQAGNDVYIVTSQYTFNEKGEAFFRGRQPEEYINKEGIKVSIIAYNKMFGFKDINANYRIYEGLYSKIDEIRPDIIFCHGPQTFSMGQIKRYMKRNKNVVLYVDSHADFRTAPVNTFKKYILQRFIWGSRARQIAPYTKKFWGTLPDRVVYLQKIYRIDKEKTDLLIMGGDVTKKTNKEKLIIRNRIREQFGIAENVFLICTGGKIDKQKNIHLLLGAMSNIKSKDVKLLVFGQANNEMRNIIDSYSSNDSMKMIGWIPSSECYDIFYASDLAVFPGTHSVLWENACTCELPIVVKRWQNTEHIDVGGNCKFLDEDSVDEIANVIDDIVSNKTVYQRMLEVSVRKCYDVFSYEKIARRAIEDSE
jgi:glycosyltransferase involved in cell wall biosynthesis